MSDRTTLLDIAREQEPDGGAAEVYEILNELDPMLKDGPAYPSNAEMAERVTLRSSLPTVQSAQVNRGTERSKGTTRQRVDTIAFIDARSEVDCRLEKIKGPAAVAMRRRNEDNAFVEAMQQHVANLVLYGDELTNPADFTGFMPRLASLATAITGSQVESMGTVTGGDGTSLLIVDWGEQGSHFIYPKEGAHVAGMSIENKGEVEVEDDQGRPFFAFVTAYNWLIGLTNKDPRRLGRLANIDVSDAMLSVPTQGELWEKLNDIYAMMPSKGGNRRVIYAARQIVGAFKKQAANKSNAALGLGEHHGEQVAMFHGCPIVADDAFSIAESTVS